LKLSRLLKFPQVWIALSALHKFVQESGEVHVLVLVSDFGRSHALALAVDAPSVAVAASDTFLVATSFVLVVPSTDLAFVSSIPSEREELVQIGFLAHVIEKAHCAALSDARHDARHDALCDHPTLCHYYDLA